MIDKEYAQLLLEKAVSSNEFDRFLIGEKYPITNQYANTPTDPFLVVKAVIEKSFQDISIINLFAKGVIEISNSNEYSWLSISYLYYILLNKSSFEKEIDINYLASVLGNNLKEKIDALKGNKKWIGSTYKDGLWGYIKNLSNILKEDYEIDLNLE